MEHSGDGNTICGSYAWNNLLRISKETGNLEIREPIETTALSREY